MWSYQVVCFLFFLTGLTAAFSHQEFGHHALHKAHAHKAGRRHRATANDTILRFEPEPYNKKLELKSAGKIHCKVAGGTSPTVQWFKNAEDPLPEGVTSSNGTLIIPEAEKRHSGNYTCKATDGEHTISSVIQLDVVVSPRVLRPATDTILAAVNSSVLLPCDATGDPAPTTHWDRNLTVLNSQEGTPLPPESSGVGGRALIVCISVAAAYMLLVLALMFYCRRRRLRRRERGEKIELEMAEGREKLVEEGEEGEEEKKKVGNGTHTNGRLLHDKEGSGADNSEVSAVSRASKKSGQYDHLAVPRTLLTEQITLGRGEFGDVALAKIDINQVKKHRGRGEGGDVKMKPVLVKMLTAKDESTLCEFRRQLELFSRIKHENIVKLIALCNDGEPHCLILEHTDWGDLKSFLLATRHPESDTIHKCPPLVDRHNAMISAQLASGLLPISQGRLTHRDIACRNCMITSSLQLKLSFPALSRGPLTKEYYNLHDRIIPLRWCPLEAVEGEYSTKSDVYMFAATVWEIYTKAELPFSKMSDKSVLEKLKNGTLEWIAPDNMPEKLVNLLKRCWSHSPSDRPQFTEICEEMKTIMKEASEDRDDEDKE